MEPCASVVVGVQAVADLTELLKDIQDSLYNPAMLDPNQPIGDSAYRDFVAQSSLPWKIGYASSYAGNTWRAAVMDRLQNVIIPKWQKLGLISDVVITQSNLNDSTQIQQMRQLVVQGADAIIVCCSNPTALNQTVEYAHSKGVAVFSSTGYLTSPYSVNASANFVVGGNMMRTLEGQGPKIQSILAKPIAMSKDEMLAAIAEDCSEDSDRWYEPGIDKWAPAAFLDNFFLRPADPEKYAPASYQKL